jgi:hypothetical protein
MSREMALLKLKLALVFQFPLMFSGRVMRPPVISLYSVRLLTLFCVVLNLMFAE